MKQLIFILALCCHFLISLAAPSGVRTDSLERLLSAMPHDSLRLQTIQSITRMEQTTPKCIYYSNMLLKEAVAQDNPKYAGIALYFQVIYYYNQNELDSVIQKIADLEPYARKAGLWDYYFDSQRCQIDLYSYREQIELAINKSLEMYKKAQEANNIRGLIGAKQCLANAYMGTGRWKEGKQALEEAHKLLPQMNNVIVRNSVLCQLISLSKANKDLQDQKKYLDEQKKILSDYIAENPTMKEAFQDPMIFNDIYYTYYYVEMEQPQLALQHLKKGNEYLTPNTYFMYRVLYHDAHASYYRLCKEYNRAISQLDSTVILLKDAFSSDYVNQLSIKADILTEAGRSLEAIPIYEKVIQMKDSLVTELSDKQMNLIQDNYHVDKMKLEEEQLKSKIQLLVFCIIAITLLVLIFFTIRAYQVRKALKTAESETRKATLMIEKANETKNHFLSNMSYNIRIPLNGVVGFSQLIASEPNMNESTRQEYSAIIQKNSEELIQLVNDVLDLSRLEANMMKFQIQTYDVIALCNDAIYMAQMHNEGAISILFSTNIDAQNITTDTGRITQTLLSTLVYPDKSKEKRKIIFTVNRDDTSKIIHFQIINSPLADPKYHSQQVSIRHEINDLLLKHFGGSYAVTTDKQGGQVIDFTLPPDSISG
ncbi:histidine kinase dimerization/phospho-acceptor domain-containing protein [Bacteroides nordii]|uniref:ATP-binding protein n=1 Tax=Bacteroides nordii TaxID=291645 RepID=UPI0039B5D63E